MSEAMQEQSRDRLLLAAAEIFAEKGFQRATVREICSRAEANVAAVNYYFRNKEGLYAQALAFAFHEAEQRYPLAEASNPNLPAEQRLRHFIHIFLRRILDDSVQGHHGKLIAREIAEPTDALNDIVNTVIAPVFTLLADIVRQIIAFELDADRLQRCLLSILGQCLMYKHSRPVVERLCPQLISTEAEIEHCAEHIVQFSLAGLRQLERQAEEAAE